MGVTRTLPGPPNSLTLPPAPQEGRGPCRPGGLAVTRRVRSAWGWEFCSECLPPWRTPSEADSLCSLSVGPTLFSLDLTSVFQASFPCGHFCILSSQDSYAEGGGLSLKFSKGEK